MEFAIILLFVGLTSAQTLSENGSIANSTTNSTINSTINWVSCIPSDLQVLTFKAEQVINKMSEITRRIGNEEDVFTDIYTLNSDVINLRNPSMLTGTISQADPFLNHVFNTYSNISSMMMNKDSEKYLQGRITLLRGNHINN